MGNIGKESPEIYVLPAEQPGPAEHRPGPAAPEPRHAEPALVPESEPAPA